MSREPRTGCRLPTLSETFGAEFLAVARGLFAKRSFLYCVIAFAVFGAFGLVPQDVARYGVIALPALAAVSIFTQRPCAPCGKIRA